MRERKLLYDSKLRVILTNHRDGYEETYQKLHYPFCLENLIVPFENLAEKMKNVLANYEVIVGDDVSGRLPALVFAELVKRKREQRSLNAPRTFFVNAGSNLSHFEESDETLKQLNQLIDRRDIPKDTHVLVVTEYICSGLSMHKLLEEIRGHGLKPDACALSIHNIPERYFRIPGRLYFGEIGEAAGALFHFPHLTGVSSTNQSPVSTPLSLSPEDRKNFINARKDVKVLADYLWQIVKS